jgi:histidinol-phosphate/aromatic aminotransferase/cobyric acid decarboxylase-like protein/choline kinase
VRAIVLAAGAGRRMLPLTRERHKALLPVGSSTIMKRLVSAIERAGVDDITVVVGYRAQEIRDYLLGDCPGPRYSFPENHEYANTNNIVSLLAALDERSGDEDVLLAECDVLLAPGVLQGLAGEDRGNLALVDHYRAGMDGTVVRCVDGLLARVFPPSAQGEEFEYRDTYKTLNVYRFTAGFCSETLAPALRNHLATNGDRGVYYEAVLEGLGDLREHRIAAQLVASSDWAEVDDPNDLAAARFSFEPDARAALLDRAHGGHWNLAVTDFGHMRNARFPTPAILAALRHGLAGVLDSYGSAQPVLNEKLGWFLDCAPERVLALNGASQAFPILRRMWADQSVAIPAPTFGEYAAAFPQAEHYSDGPGVEMAEVDALAGRCRLVVVVNPNNPTGTTIGPDEIHDLARRRPLTQFLVDESFYGFGLPGSVREELEQRPLDNVLVLSSLSKMLGVPGLRIGYAYCTDRALLDRLEQDIPIWNMGSLAELFLELLLKFRPELEASLAQTSRDRELFAAELTALAGVERVWQSGGNFLLIELDPAAGDAAWVRRELLARASLEVKDVTEKFPDRSPRLRLAVRLPQDNARLVAALAAVLG